MFSYFSRSHGDVARSVLSHSHHPRYDYPYAIVVINLTSLGHGWLKEGQLDRYLYRGDELNENTFYEIIGEPHTYALHYQQDYSSTVVCKTVVILIVAIGFYAIPPPPPLIIAYMLYPRPPPLIIAYMLYPRPPTNNSLYAVPP